MYWGYVSVMLVLVSFLQWDRRITFYSVADSVVDIRALFLFSFKIYPYK